MNQIVIPVEESVAEKWHHRSEDSRREISAQLEKLLVAMMNQPDDDLWSFLYKIRQEAEKRGFSDEVLDQLLHEK
jgi:hypothetical protein